MRIPSSSVIGTNNNGTFTVNQPVKIGGVTLNKIVFSPGVKIGGIDLTNLIGKELEVEKQDGLYVIKGYYAAT